MVNEARINLLARVAQVAPVPVDPEKPASILSLAAASYGSRPLGDATIPTGFDPLVAALFEAIVEGAYIVATSDGVFDAEERRMFERVVVAACGGKVGSQQIAALVSDLRHQLEKDGVDRRIDKIARSTTKSEQAHEVLRVAALLACVSNDASSIERSVLGKLASRLGIEPSEIDKALGEARALMTRARSGK